MRRDQTRNLAILLLASCLLAGGCGKTEEPPPGPAEQLGRELDKTMLGAVKKAEEVQKKLGERLEETGKDMQNPE
jgi:hypothetical protein